MTLYYSAKAGPHSDELYKAIEFAANRSLSVADDGCTFVFVDRNHARQVLTSHRLADDTIRQLLDNHATIHGCKFYLHTDRRNPGVTGPIILPYLDMSRVTAVVNSNRDTDIIYLAHMPHELQAFIYTYPDGVAI